MITSSQKNVAAFNEQVVQISKEISRGEWNNRSDELGQKITDLMSSIAELHLDNGAGKEALNSVQSLNESLIKSPSKNSTIRGIVKTIRSINLPNKSIKNIQHTLNIEIPKLRGYETKHEISDSLRAFRLSIKKHAPDAEEALARWISYNKIPLAKLRLTHKEIVSVVPYLTYLDLSGMKLNPTEILSILNLAQNANHVILTGLSLGKELPELPANVKVLNCEQTNLEEISTPPGLERLYCAGNDFLRSISFNEGLKHVDCHNCPNLVNLSPELPESMESFNSDSCINLEQSSKINTGLKTYSCANCPLLEIPSLNEGLLAFDCSDNSISILPALPSTLASLEATELPNLRALGVLPDELERANFSGCPFLTQLTNIPESLKEIHLVGTPLNLPAYDPDDLTVYR